VRGLNSGLDDAANLAWKLALVAQGQAPANLLASYTSERHAACLENIASATKSTWFMSPPSPGFTLARDAVLELAVKHPAFRVLIDPRQSAAHHYRSSAVAPSNHPLVGLPLPEARLADGRSLHDLLGTGFCALVFSGTAPVRATPRALGYIDYVDVNIPSTDPSATVLGASAGDVFLIRSDGYVAAAGVEGDSLLAVVLHMLSQIGLPQEEKLHVLTQ